MSEYSKRLYTIASKAGLVDKNSHNDPFHQIIYGITGKESVTELTYSEAKLVETEIFRKSKFKNNVKARKRENISGMMTPSQQAYAWKLMYLLESADPSDTDVSQRLAGAVRHELKISASPRDPLRWVTSKDAVKLIEALKRYLKHTERKAGR